MRGLGAIGRYFFSGGTSAVGLGRFEWWEERRLGVVWGTFFWGTSAAGLGRFEWWVVRRLGAVWGYFFLGNVCRRLGEV